VGVTFHGFYTIQKIFEKSEAHLVTGDYRKIIFVSRINESLLNLTCSRLIRKGNHPHNQFINKLKERTMKKIAVLLLTILALSSCQSGNKEKSVNEEESLSQEESVNEEESVDEEEIVTVEGRYAISIPSFLTEVTTLNEDASLQYQNPFKEFYVIVIDEPKSELEKALKDNNLTDSYSSDLNGYSDLLLSGMEQSISVENKSKIIDKVVNKMPAKFLTISGQVQGIDAFYALAFFEGKERYYQVMSWTLADRKNQHKEEMNRILHSLKEL